MNKDRHIDIMGIVNLTDDSYYAQSRCRGVGSTLEKVEAMLSEGATIIDIGACSTRPGAVPVGAAAEWERLEPVLKALKEAWPEVRISIDTWWSGVVARAYDLIGDFVVNDISSGEDDPQMLSVAGSLGLTYIAMHKRGNPLTMQTQTVYADVVGDILEYFRGFSEKAAEAGIRDWILDPGFGFAKDISQNYEMLSRLEEFKSPGRPLLVGISRKSMIYKLLGITPEESLPATQALHMKALQSGADILRVHDVAEAVRTVRLYKML